MYSQCPECLTRFRVTAAALRAAHGTVRCGRCGSAFDALQRLTDTVPDETEAPPPSSSMLGSTIAAFDAPGLTGSGEVAESSAGGAEVGVDTEFHFSADDIEQVFIDARDAATAQKSVAADDAASTIPAAGAPVVFVHEPEAIEDITLEGERIVVEGLPEFDAELRQTATVTDIDIETWSVEDDDARDDAIRFPDLAPLAIDPDPTDRFELLRGVRPPAANDSAGETVGNGEPHTPATPPPPIVPFRLRPPAAEPGHSSDALVEQHSGDTDRHGHAVAWGLGALLLAIALVAQLTHHYRQDLARSANLGPVIRGVYARLGRPLHPNSNLAAFEVRQWSASEAGPTADGAMIVRASLRNGAGFAQSLPLLRLELEDRFGDTVARRDFEPAEYLKDRAQASRLLASGAKTEAELDVVTAGSDAVGYRLDVCMREETGAVRCAQASPADDGSVAR